MTGTDPTPPNEASTRSPSSEGAEPARPLLDIFEGLIAPNTQEEDLTSDSLEIEVKESNVRVRFVGDTQAPRIGSESDVLPGRLEIELQTASGRTIDTITMSQLTMKSLKLVLNKLTRTDPRERFLGLTRMMGDPFLTQGKLRELLIVAGSELVQIASALGNNPSDIAANYSGQFSRARSGEDDRDRYLTMLERNSTFSVVLHGLAQARALGIGKVLVPANAPSIVDEVSRSRGDMNVIWVVPKAAVQEVNLSEDESGDIVYFSTNPKITPEAEQRLALFYALARGHLGVDDRVLCLKGASSSPVLTG
ncbi:MAG: hypothetical protein KDD55_10425, partial [Bdellovibrionales bacterium]|nr:hypothetical protein [Bdellovibrionales bacterium]